MSKDETILRTFRVPLWLDEEIRNIAEQENRTMSNTIYHLLTLAIKKYKAGELK